jgi:hemolysin activation/secretion protein
MIESPQLEGFDASLDPGAVPGQGVLTLDVREADVFRLGFTADNYRAPSTGEVEIGAHARFQNFFGSAETLSLSHFATEGLDDTIVRLEVPVTPRDTTVFLGIERSEAEVVEGFASRIDVESRSTEYEIGVRHPVYRRVGRSLVASVSLNPRRSTTFLLGRRFSFSPGVQDGRSKVAPLRLGLDWLDRDRSQVVAMRSTLSVGLGILGSTENPDPLPDGEYVAWLGQFQYVRRLDARGDQILVRAEAQLTPDRLLPLEKFTVGGPLSVRGYLHNQLVRDNGYSASVEGRIPLFRLPVPGLSRTARDGTLALAPFLDLGRAWNTEGPTPDPRFISSFGVGLRWQPSDNVQGSVYFAKALSNVPDEEEDSLQSSGVSFELAIGLF